MDSQTTTLVKPAKIATAQPDIDWNIKFWTARRFALRFESEKLWAERDWKIDLRTLARTDEQRRELHGWIDQLAIAAEIVDGYASLCYVNAYEHDGTGGSRADYGLGEMGPF